MTTGPKQLVQWLERRELLQGEFARMLSLSDAAMSKIATGKRRPSLAIAVRIQELTGIPESSWVDKRRGRTAQSRTRVTDKPQVDTELSHV